MVPFLLLASLLAADLPASLLVNGGFDGVRGWQLGEGRLAPRDGGRCLRFDVPSGASQEVLAPKPGKYTVALDMRTLGVQKTAAAGYAFAAIYQLDDHNELVAYKDFIQLTGDHPWQRYTWTFETAPTAHLLSVRCGMFQAAGAAEFDNVTLVAGETARRLDEVTQFGGPRTGAPHAGILVAPDLPVTGTASSPRVLRRLLEQAGYGVEELSPEQLADPALVQPSRFDLLVIPTGESFPAIARETVTDYLHHGGSFVSMGGYAFNRLLLKDGARWLPERELMDQRLDAALSADRSQLPDGSFETTGDVPVGGQTMDGQWHRSDAGPVIVKEGPKLGQRCARVSAPPEKLPDETKFWLDLPAKAGLYRVSGWVRTKEVEGPGKAYLALYQYAEDGKLLAFRDFGNARGTTDWTRYTFDFSPMPGVARIHVKFGLYRATGTAWFDDLRLGNITGLRPQTMNTATGGPGDGLQVLPTQIGAFDADTPLHSTVAVSRWHQAGAAPSVVLKPAKPLQGWQATAVLGQDNVRWVPVLEDQENGQPIGALARHHSGYFAGSQWAIFGVDNLDLFADPGSPASRLLTEVLRSMARGAYLHSLRTDQRLYRPGETVNASVVVEDARPAGAVRVRFDLLPAGGGQPVASQTRDVSGDPPVTVEAKLACPATAPLYEVRATLLLGDVAADTLRGGVTTPATAPAPPPLRFVDNGFRLGNRPLFIFGSDTYANSYSSAAHNPLTWDAEHRAAREIGLDLYENLQYSNPGHVMKETDWRAFEAMAQSTQRHGLIFMPGMLIGHNVVTDDEELARQAAQCRGYAERLGKTPALLWYINGDYQLRTDEEPKAATLLWNRWLKEKYANRPALEASWGAGRVKLDGDQVAFPPPDNLGWRDPAQVDRMEFQTWTMRRWNAAHVQAVRERDPDHPITSEYYQQPFGGIDLRETIDGQDVANIGYFDRPRDDLAKLPLRLRWNDLRYRGKGVSLGEYGIKTHPAWSLANGAGGYHPTRTQEEAAQLFLAVATYTLGSGGCKVQNWCLRDAPENVFPWGMFYADELVPKPLAYVHRNISLLVHPLAPQSPLPALSVCLPHRMRLGNLDHDALEAGLRSFDALLGLHADFDVVDDNGLDQLPAQTKAMILPSPYTMDDADFDRLVAWVRGGGKLLVTGDLSYDAMRRDTRRERLTTLCGVKLAERLGEPPFRPAKGALVDLGAVGKAELHPCVRVEPQGATVLAKAGDVPALTEYRLGQGTVQYLTDPLEFGRDDDALTALRTVYARFLEPAGIARLAITPDDPAIHVYARPTATGTLYVAYSRTFAEGQTEVTIPTPEGPLTLGLRHGWPAMAHVGGDKQVRLLLTWGNASLAGKPLAKGEGLFGLWAMDNQDVRSSRRLVATTFCGARFNPARPMASVSVAKLLGQADDPRGGNGAQLLWPTPVPPAAEQDAAKAALLNAIREPWTLPGL